MLLPPSIRPILHLHLLQCLKHTKMGVEHLLHLCLLQQLVELQKLVVEHLLPLHLRLLVAEVIEVVEDLLRLLRLIGVHLDLLVLLQ